MGLPRFPKALLFLCSLCAFSLEAEEATCHLRLEDVISETLLYQWSIQTSELAIDAQAGLLEQATGAFNPDLAAAFSTLFQRDIQTSVGLKTGLNGRTVTSNLSLQTLARLGTTYGFSYQNSNVLNPAAPPRTDMTTLTFNVTQPLLRNLFFSPATTLEKTQDLLLKAAKYQNIQNIAQAVATSINSYWDLVAALKLLKIQQDQEKRLCLLAEYAEQLVKENQEGYTSVYQPQADLALATASRIQAEQNVRAAYNVLLFNMGLIPDDHQEIPELTLEDYPIPEDLCILERSWYDKCLVEVPNKRSDVIAAQLLIEAADLNLTSAKNSLLPELNLTGSAELLNTTALNRARSLFESSNFHGPEKDYTVGISFNFPIFNDTAKGLVKQDRALKAQAIVNANLLGGQITSNFKTFYTLYNSLLREVKRTRMAVEDYRKTVESEFLKLREGLSSYFIVLTQQNSWQAAQIQLIVFENLFVQNLVQLRLTAGELIKWDSPDQEIGKELVMTTLDLFKQAPCETIREKEEVLPCEPLPENAKEELEVMGE